MDLSLHSAQKQIALDPHRFRVLCCGRRFGKTTLAIDQIKGRAAIPNSRVAYIAPTYQQARDIAWAQLKADCKDAASSINESRLEIRLVNNSLIVLRGWESIETLRGQQFDLIVLDEVAMFRGFEQTWQEVIRPTLTDTKGEALFISTPKGFNHFYELFNKQEEDTDYKSFHFPTTANPHIPPEEIDKARQELSPERFAQEYLADFKKTEGLVYKEFDRQRHLYTELPQGTEIVEKIAGVDFGWTNPAAVIELWRDRADTFWLASEWYETQKTDAEVAEYVSAKGFNRVYPDPEAPAAIEEMKRRKVNVREVIKGKDSIENGIRKVQDAFRANKLRIHVSCKNTIMELETYSYPDRKPDHNESELPIDENNHAMDALRYPIFMLSGLNERKTAHQYVPKAIQNPVNRVIPNTAHQYRPVYKKAA